MVAEHIVAAVLGAVIVHVARDLTGVAEKVGAFRVSIRLEVITTVLVGVELVVPLVLARCKEVVRLVPTVLEHAILLVLARVLKQIALVLVLKLALVLLEHVTSLILAEHVVPLVLVAGKHVSALIGVGVGVEHVVGLVPGE